MPITVYAENMGLFHKGSGGQGIAPADVCLSPPPAPTGPVPVPYINVLQASDLADGSKSVKIDGNPTALEDKSNISTSSGDEAGNQGGNVVTHKTKGKGYFKLWSFTVKIEDKGVDRHGDPLGQNCGSTPPGCIDQKAIVEFLELDWVDPDFKCPPDSHPSTRTNKDQRANVRGGPCWQCVEEGKPGLDSGRSDSKNFTPDHQPPVKAAWYMGGCANPDKFAEWVKSKEAAESPHCKAHSSSQGGTMSHQTVDSIRSWM